MAVKQEPWPRARFALRFQQAEHLLYIVVGATLAVAGFALFAHVVFGFLRDVLVRDRTLSDALIDGVDGLLLVFIFAELLHTVRVVIAHDELRTEPFLIVGIVAAIRRFIVASAEAAEFMGTDRFDPLLRELAVLMGGVLVLSVAIWLIRASHSPSALTVEAERTT
jgi:uncharacterized membrane protein (DUF373 family)